MSSTTPTTVIGYVSQDVQVQQTRDGKPFANVSVPHQRSRKNRQTNEWENVGETTWHQATFWDDDAALVAAAVRKGTKVILSGQPEVRAYSKADGTAAASVNLLFATLGVIPAAPRNGGPQPAEQPWTPQGNTSTADTWNAAQGGYDDETPF